MTRYDYRQVTKKASYQWYVQHNKPNRVVYGPYPDKLEAMQAYLMTIPYNLVGDAIGKWGSWWWRKLQELPEVKAQRYFAWTMSEDDLEAGINDPESNGYKSMKVKPPQSLKPHPSWKGHDPELTHSWAKSTL
jgi:hypothetical protein